MRALLEKSRPIFFCLVRVVEASSFLLFGLQPAGACRTSYLSMWEEKARKNPQVRRPASCS